MTSSRQSARTRLLCLLGHPVAHSASPELQNAALAEVGFDAVYLALDVPPAAVADAVAGLRAVSFLGGNVTVPHKRAVAELLDARTREAETVGAVNTLFWDGERLVGDNTDAAGLQTFLSDEVGFPAGESAVIFGAGGAARAAAVALGRLGATVEVVARREDAAVDTAALARRAGADIHNVAQPRLVLNATPLGMHGEALPERFMSLNPGQVAVDLVYGRTLTPFLAAAREAGAAAYDGLGLLVAQAALSFERWTAQPAPRAVMAAAARSAVHGRRG